METLKINKPIRLIELFAGIGSQAKALKRLGADFEHYRICEFDKYAIKSYNAIHGTDFATSDITQISAKDLGIVDTDKYCYIMTYSFPCQDLSLAGKQKGMAKGENTRSGLLWEVERLLNKCDELPQILLMENVTQVHGKKNKEHFDEWIAFLESKGYSNYWKDLNAKNFGIPQNRNRCFMVSVLGDYTYEFPKEFPLGLRLKDMLEENVDEKFYLSDAMIERLNTTTYESGKFEKRVLQESGISRTLCARDYKDPKCVEVEPKVIAGIGEKKSNGGTQWYQQDRVYDGDVAISVTTAFNPYYKVDEPKIQKVCQLDGAHEQSGRVYSADGISPTIMSNSHGKTEGGYTSPKVVDPFIVASRGRNPENPSDRTAGIPTEQRLEPNFSGCSNTLTTVQKDNYVAEPVIIEDFYKNREERVYDGVAPTLRSERIGLKVAEPNECGEKFSSVEKTEQLFEAVKDGEYPPDTAYGKYLFQSSRFDDKPLEECSQTIKSTKVDCGVIHNLRIRKLTPKECWRLMGFDDADFEKAATVNSNSQLYKQAGNSIVVDVLYYIFREMF